MSGLAERLKVNLDLWNLFIAIVTLDKTYKVKIMTLASGVFKKSTFPKFPHLNALGSKFDLDVNSLISRTDKVELIATEFFSQSCDCLGYLEQHTKSCKSYLVGKYIYFRLKNDLFMLKVAIEEYCLVNWTLLLQLF